MGSLTYTLTHNYYTAGTYAPVVSASVASGVSGTDHTNSFDLNNDCANITGRLYADVNGSCAYETGEPLLPGLFVKATNTATGAVHYGTYTTTGNYSLNLAEGGTYDITAGSWWADMVPACGASGSTTLTVTASGSYTQDFGFSCSTGGPDMSVYASAGCFRPGETRGLSVYGFSNELCSGTPAVVTLTLPAHLSYVSTASGAVPEVSDHTLTWAVANLSGVDEFISHIQVYTEPEAAIGDTVCMSLVATPVGATDPDVTNNSYSFCVPIVNSYDPNEKLVAPKGSSTEGNIPLNTGLLTYQINFQNTGTDVAYNVTIKDVLDAEIDPASIHVLGGSHTFTAAIANGNELQFRFNNIMLPDSNVNEPGSHGYLIYQARLKPGLSAGTVVNNTANIYFDYNDAVVTNTTVNTLFDPTAVQQLQAGRFSALVFPNPAANVLTVKAADNSAFTATLTDITGRIVLQQSGQEILELNTASLPAGIYQLGIQSGVQELHTKVVVAR